MVPEVKRKVFVGAAESGNEMVFEGANCMFGCIASVIVGWHWLEIDVLVVHKIF